MQFESYADFQGLLDGALDKANPDASIPWPASPTPNWAARFKPKAVVDIGCAQGYFTSSVLSRLGQWGCLQELEHLTLIDTKAGFGSLNFHSGHEAAASRCRELLKNYTLRDIAIDVICGEVGIHASQRSSLGYEIEISGSPLPPADLYIASHILYYFSSGDRIVLMQVLASRAAVRKGFVWLVMRKGECPIYRNMRNYLQLSNLPDDSEDYAESVNGFSKPRHLATCVVDQRDCCFLYPNHRPENCPTIVFVLMWRMLPTCGFDISRCKLAADTCVEGGALFSERHWILSFCHRAPGC